MTQFSDIAAIAIGRNEGTRLIACLEALQGQVSRIIYVDSGSTDGSADAAKRLGAEVVELDMSVPFTAARARNAGRDFLKETSELPAFVQFLDSDCVLQPEWLGIARGFLNKNPKAAAVCGRRRERYPDASIYNRLIDAEWDGAAGLVKSCGGDALMRWTALEEVGGFAPSLIAGEEPELCVRLRANEWEIWRLDAEMTLHDAALTRFGQWWQRSRRGGFAYAEGFAMHGSPPEFHKSKELKRAMLWGVVLPILTVFGLLLSPFALILLLAWPAQIARLRSKGHAWINAIFLTLAKLPEGQGALTYYWRRFRGSRNTLIEYK